MPNSVGDESTCRRFVREARAAASVRHPNVASVFHLGKNGDSCFYAMECKRANDQYVARDVLPASTEGL
jgi:serine/threonine protein kinase